MRTYYAKIKIEGVNTSIPVSAEANSSSDAKKIIEARNGKVKTWIHHPSSASKPPHWFK